MDLTLRQKALVHVLVQRFDRETQTTTLDPPALASQLSTNVDDLAADIAELLRRGYLERVGREDDVEPTSEEAWDTSEPWVVSPTDRAVLSAMGLE